MYHLLKITIDRKTGTETGREIIGTKEGEINYNPLCDLILDKMAEDGLIPDQSITASERAG